MFHPVADISVLGPAGELDRSEGGVLLERIVGLLQRDWRKIVLDLGEVHHVHFGFLTDLSTLAQLSSAVSGGIKLANLNRETSELLKITGVDRTLEAYDSVAEAILSFDVPLPGTSRMQ